MKIDLRNATVKWINLDKDTEKNEQMKELCERIGLSHASRVRGCTGADPHDGSRSGVESTQQIIGTIGCAESHFKVFREAIEKDTFPLLVLEDDVEVQDHFSVILDGVPDDADAIYMGTSQGDGRYAAVDVGSGWMKIERVFATHAILYLNKTICEEIIKTCTRWIYEVNRPFDLGIAYEVQPKHKVYAPHVPFFYQADSKNTVNKWEGITKTPLRRQKKFSVFTI